MNVYTELIKKYMDKYIDKETKVIPFFSKNTGKYFTRSKKWPIEKLMQFLIFMGG